MRFEIYESGIADFERREYHEQWYWRLRARNGRIIADSAESYASKAGVKKAVWRLQKMMIQGALVPVMEVES